MVKWRGMDWKGSGGGKRRTGEGHAYPHAGQIYCCIRLGNLLFLYGMSGIPSILFAQKTLVSSRALFDTR